MTMIENFRPVQGTERIYRCAKTEPLATEPQLDPVMAQKIGLVLDLRSEAERDPAAEEVWMQRYGFRRDTGTDCVSSSNSWSSSEEEEEEEESPEQTTTKRVVHLDVQPRDRVIHYLDTHWLTPPQRAWNVACTIFDTERQHRMRMDALNERGLLGLNEAILETGGVELCRALVEMTRHLESTSGTEEYSSVVFHCVQGKDRTGMLAMLIQSILGCSDELIVNEYAQSEVMRDPSVAAGNIVTVQGRFDRGRFTGAPPEVMRETLSYLRSKYSSINPGYLDSIGFDARWRKRFVKCQTNRRSNRSSKL